MSARRGRGALLAVNDSQPGELRISLASARRMRRGNLLILAFDELPDRAYADGAVRISVGNRGPSAISAG